MMHNSPLTMLPPLNRMELGFFETNINGREVIAHLGDTQYFHTSLHLFLKENVGFYVSFNSPGKEGAAGGLRNALFQDFADRYFPGDETETSMSTTRPRPSMRRCSRAVGQIRAARSQLHRGARFGRPDQGRRQRQGRAGAAFPGTERQAAALGRDCAVRVARCRGP